MCLVFFVLCFFRYRLGHHAVNAINSFHSCLRILMVRHAHNTSHSPNQMNREQFERKSEREWEPYQTTANTKYLEGTKKKNTQAHTESKAKQNND